MKKIIKKLLPLLGIILFIYILIRLGISQIFYEIINAKILFLILALIFVIAFLVTQTLKWFIIARFQKIRIPFLEALKINLISNFYGFITPSKIGTISRVKYLKKYTNKVGKGICNFVLDKILDIVSVIFIAILFSFIFQERFSVPIYPLIFLFGILILTIIIFINKGRSKTILRIVYKKLIPDKFKEKAKLTFDSFYEDIPKISHFVGMFLFNILNWILMYFIIFIIAISLNINLDFKYFLAILPLGTLVGLMPITINGLGTREATLIFLFNLFNIESTKVVSMSLLAIFLTSIIPGIIALFFIFRKRK